MTQATPNTHNQNQNTQEGQAAEQAKPARPRRARRPASGARVASSANSAAPTPAAETAASSPGEQAAQHAPQAHQEPQAAQQPRARRSRRPTQPQAAQAAAPTTATPAAAAQAPVPAPHPELPTPPQPVASTESGEAPAGQQKKRTTRGGRGHRGGRKSEVQLVKPAEVSAEQSVAEAAPPAAPELQTASEAEAAPEPEAEPRVVPVVTQSAPAITGAPTSGAEAAAEPAASAPAASPFRFGRRAGATSATPAAAAPVPTHEPVSLAALAAPSAPAQSAFEAPETEEEEPWQATVAEIEPASLPSAAETSADAALDDLVAALGLQGAGVNTTAPTVPEAAVPDATAQRGEEVAAETPAESEGEAEAEDERQGATRRRRRRRGKSTSVAAAADESAAEPLTTPEWAAERELRNGYERATELSQPYTPYNRPPRERLAPVAEPERPEESPFGSPEPQMARGFGPQPRGVAGPAPSSLQRPARERERLETPPMSPNQLGNMLTHAIQQQTDRLLGELRRQPQGPAMTFAVPLPSTERVGIFVDVANLLYSARSQRIALDFGKVLDFLRGNRRLIRAHAYAPTNPEPGAEQSFLNAVRGLGYRITTKNFKTFASGAKKADMDLDLCMDIVRMVDAGALDTVVLVSGDSDFLPLLEYASDHGVRVEVAAFEDAAAQILRQSCDLFVNLSLVEGLQR